MQINSVFRLFFACLSVAIIALSWILLTSGPRIRLVTYDTVDLVRNERPRVYMHSNQPLRKDKLPNLKMNPDVGFSTLVSGETIIIEFDSALEYSRTYSISIDGFESSSTGREGTYTATVRTPDPAFLYIQRTASDPDADDNVYLYKNGKSTAIYTAPRINEIIPVGDTFAVVSEGASRDTIMLYDTVESKEVTLENGDQVSSVSGSEDGSLLGFAVTSLDSTRQSTLVLYDTTTGVSIRPNGLDGKPLQVKDWLFMPGGDSVVAITKNNDLLVIDIATDEIIPLGYADTIRGFEGLTYLVIGNKGKIERLNLETRERTTLNPTLFAGLGPLLGNYIPAAKNASAVTHISFYSYVDETYMNTIASRRDGADKQLYQFSSKNTLLLHTGVTGNGNFALVETAETNEATFDDYRIAAKPSNVTTKVMHTSTGTVEKVFDGFNVIELPRILID